MKFFRRYTADAITILYGTASLITGGEYVGVKNISIYPNFDPISLENDLSLLELSDEVKYSDKVKSIPLAKAKTSFAGKKGRIAGWGATKDENESEILREAEVEIVANVVCNLLMHNQITDGMICAGKLFGGTDTCKGDSGAPLTVKDGDEWKLVGTASWGYGCGEFLTEGVYTRVPKYKEWIGWKTGI